MLHDYSEAFVAYLHSIVIAPDDTNVIHAAGHALAHCIRPDHSDNPSHESDFDDSDGNSDAVDMDSEPDEVDDFFRCTVCKDIFTYPVTHTCGHTTDQHCLYATGACPYCQQGEGWSDVKLNLTLNMMLTQVFPDRITEGTPSEEKCDAVIAANPLSFQGFYARSKLRLARGDGESALDDVNKAVELSPLNPFVRETRAVVLFRLQRPLDSLADALAAMKHMPAKPSKAQIDLALESVCAVVRKRKEEDVQGPDIVSELRTVRQLLRPPVVLTDYSISSRNPFKHSSLRPSRLSPPPPTAASIFPKSSLSYERNSTANCASIFCLSRSPLGMCYCHVLPSLHCHASRTDSCLIGVVIHSVGHVWHERSITIAHVPCAAVTWP